jgi:hypothetical protein
MIVELQDMTVYQYCKLLWGDYRLLCGDLSMITWAEETEHPIIELGGDAFFIIEDHLDDIGWENRSSPRGWDINDKGMVLYSAVRTPSACHRRMHELEQLAHTIMGLNHGLRWLYKGTSLQLPQGRLLLVELRPCM